MSVIVPTRNEKGNVTALAARLERAFEPGWNWELVFVDDSSDPDFAEGLRIDPRRLDFHAEGLILTPRARQTEVTRPTFGESRFR